MLNATNAHDSTRRKVLAAAVETILEEGFYRASSNRIAERAGVSWGVIQYHFGSREQLLLAVATEGSEHLLESVRNAEIKGDTLSERLDSLADVIWEHYRQPAFLAHVQVLLNLAKDPRTSAGTVEALAETERTLGGLWQRLIDQVVAGEHQRPGLGGMIFQLIRGLAIGQNLIEALPHTISAPAGNEPREVLVRALTLLLESM
jgi:AcrR family transcriptional regulator